MKLLFLIISIFCSINNYSQQQKDPQLFSKEEISINTLLKGTLYFPVKPTKKTNLVILIAGSGPTNRDGNQIGLINNSLKYLAEELAKQNSAVFSYDKRIIAQMIAGTVNEKTLSFDDFINDAKEVITYFKTQNKYNKIIVAGHSEGSLIGMIAAKDNADAYISLAGAGRTIDFVIEDQIEKQAPFLKEEVKKDLELLKKGETFELKNPILASLFRESVQPYMISWIKYDPTVEIKKLNIPILIINGTKDLQVAISEAELLKKAKREATIEIITNMNHLFKEIKGDTAENKNSYTNPDLPVIPQLITIVNQFLKTL